MRWYWGLMACTLVIAAVAGTALSWDGSYVLFRTLNDQSPWEPLGRLPSVALYEPIAWLSHVTTNLSALRIAFGLLHAAIPLLALAASWWMVRDYLPPLFVWAAFGISLATLPGQICFSNESIKDIQLFWPILLALLIHVPRAKLPLLLPLIGVVFLYHPIAIPLFAVGAGVAFLLWLNYGTEGHKMLLWAGGLGLLAVIRALQIQPGYEETQLSSAEVVKHFHVAVVGLPLIALACAWFAGAMVYLAGLSDQPTQRRRRAFFQLSAFAGVGTAGAMLVVWARDPHLWWKAIDFRWWALAASLPFMFFALLESILGRPRLLRTGACLLRDRIRLTQATGVAFAAVLSVQSVAYAGLAHELTQAMAQSPSACIPTAALGALKGTAFDHWSVSAEAIMLQSRVPQKLVLDGDGCAHARSGTPVRVVSWDAKSELWDATSEGSGWFHLRPALLQLTTVEGCWEMTSGWYAVERRDADWWRWSQGRGAINIPATHDMSVTVQGRLYSSRRPNRVNVVVNGITQRTLESSADSLQPFTLAGLPLSAGRNIVEFVSEQSPVTAPTDSRLLAIAVGDLNLTGDNIALACASPS